MKLLILLVASVFMTASYAFSQEEFSQNEGSTMSPTASENGSSQWASAKAKSGKKKKKASQTSKKKKATVKARRKKKSKKKAKK